MKVSNYCTYNNSFNESNRLKADVKKGIMAGEFVDIDLSDGESSPKSQFEATTSEIGKKSINPNIVRK